MKQLEAAGKTFNEALTAGLAQMGLDLDQVDYEILDEGAKGFLGIGVRPVRIRLTQKDSPAIRAEEFLSQVTRLIGLDVSFETEQEEEALKINMVGENQGILIGHRGETLDALQYLCSLRVNKDRDEYIRVTLDTENYRERRKATLENLAKNIASKVKRTKRPVALEPMNPYERRIMHSALQGNEQVTTHSEGEEPNRRVVIVPKR